MSTKARGELTYCGVDAGPCFDVFSTSQIHSRSVDGQASVRYVRQALRAHACSWHQTRLATSEGLCAIRGIIPMPSANAQRSCAEVLRGLLWPIPAGRSWIALADHGLLWPAAATASDTLFAAACKYPKTTLPYGVGTSAVLWQAYRTHCRARITGRGVLVLHSMIAGMWGRMSGICQPH